MIVLLWEVVSIEVLVGYFLKIMSIEGLQVGDFNLFNSVDFFEWFYFGKICVLYGIYVMIGDWFWFSFFILCFMVMVIIDMLNWYGIDEYGGFVYDVIGICCDFYIVWVFGGVDYYYCCYFNLICVLVDVCYLLLEEVECYVYDVLNVFMCIGFICDMGQYFMKVSLVCFGDYFEFFVEFDFFVVMSVCLGGDCSSEYFSDMVICYFMLMEVFRFDFVLLVLWLIFLINFYNCWYGCQVIVNILWDFLFVE